MDQEILLVIGFIGHLVLSERHVSDCHIEEIVWIVRLFKACDLHIGFRIKLSCDTSGNPVQLHAIQPALLHLLRQHTEKVSGSHCRL